MLAESILNGRLSIDQDRAMGNLDMVFVDGLYYWPLGPFPALFLIPFVFVFQKFNLFFYQGYIHPLITVGVFYLCFKLARIFKFGEKDALYLAFAFCFASVYFFVAFVPRSWYFAQAISVFFSFLALYEFYTGKRWILIGLYTSFIFATRFTAGFIVIFFLLHILFSKISKRQEKLLSIFRLFVPIAIGGILLLVYDKIRFGMWFDNGYMSSRVGPDVQWNMKERYGLFNLKNIVTNIYWYFLAPLFPVMEKETYHLIPPYFAVSPIGLSFFITSPIFINIFRGSRRGPQLKFLWATIIITLFVLLTFYASGYYQFGPRYMLDLLPGAYILLLYSFKSLVLSNKIRMLIILSILLNSVLVFYYMDFVSFRI